MVINVTENLVIAIKLERKAIFLIDPTLVYVVNALNFADPQRRMVRIFIKQPECFLDLFLDLGRQFLVSLFETIGDDDRHWFIYREQAVCSWALAS